MRISDISIARPVTTTLFSCAVVLFGIFALRTMGVDQYPVVEFPTVTVTTLLPGADPEIMDADVTDVLEEQINAIEGIENIRSLSTEGRSQIVVTFDLSKDVDVAAEEVRAKINLAQADLPADIEAPVVDKQNMSGQPIMWIAASSDSDYQSLSDYVDNVLRPQLQTIRGVGSLALNGFREREVRVWLDPTQLESRGLTPSDVAAAIRTKHIELPGGRLEQTSREFAVKVKGEYESITELRELVVFEQDNALVRLKDVATVSDGEEDLRSLARFNGRPAIGIGVRKQSGANTVEVAHNVKVLLTRISNDLPSGVKIEVATDSSRFIEDNMNDVLLDLVFGAILTSLVMLVFLRNGRMTMISITAIPTSVVGCFILMYAFGFTINTMTLLAMSLAIGVVIDDAIVVLENIQRNIDSVGLDAPDASRRGTAEVGFAVVAASSTIVAVFVPVAFMKGLIGRFFFEFGLSVALAVLISIIVSFTLTPMLCSRYLRKERQHGRVFAAFEAGFGHLERIYSRALDQSLRRRWLTLGAATACFIGGIGMVPFVSKTFVVNPDNSEFLVRYELPAGTSLQKTNGHLWTMEQALIVQPEVSGVFSTLGGEGFGVNAGQIRVNLLPRDVRSISQFDVMDRMRDRLAHLVPEALISVESISPMGSGQRNSDVQFIVRGTTIDQLAAVADNITRDLVNIPGLVDVDTDLRLNKPEVKVDIDRDLADSLGVDVQTIAENIGILYGGADVATFKQGGNRYDIRLRAHPNSRLEPDDLYQLAFRSKNGTMVKTPNLIQVQESVGPNSISRYNRSRSVTIFANESGIDLATALDHVQQAAATHMPDESGWSVALTGRSEYFADTFRYMLYAIGISIILIYLIMGSLFESFIHPFTILTSVPLAVVGGIGLLLLTGKTLDLFSFIGFIMLIGIVTKNAILLVDFTNQRRREGMDRDAALRTAGPMRLRPILMTALTTMAAISPIALGLSEGGEQRASMGVAVIGGMATSTLLTLLVVPCVYTVMDDVSNLLVRSTSRNKRTQTAKTKSIRPAPAEVSTTK